MSYGFRTVNHIKAHASSYMLGVKSGYLGHVTVRWLNERNMPPAPVGTFHIITFENKCPKTTAVSYSEFRKSVPLEQLNTLRTRVGWGARSDQVWDNVLRVNVLPSSLEEALVCLEKNEVLRASMSKEMFDCYIAVKRSEIEFCKGKTETDIAMLYQQVY